MILNNYWKWLGASQRYPITGSTAGIDVGLKDITGTACNLQVCNPYASNASWWSTLAETRRIDNCTLNIGIGNNTYTGDEYCLANDVTSSFSDLQFTAGFSYSSNFTRLYTITGTNTSGNDMSITEIGIKKVIYDGSSYQSTASKTIMLAIVQLDTPITVLNGETFTIAVEWIEQ